MSMFKSYQYQSNIIINIVVLMCRVHTLAMPVVQDLADMYKAVDAPATVNLLAKLAVEKSYHAKLDDTRSSLAVSIPGPSPQSRNAVLLSPDISEFRFPV